MKINNINIYNFRNYEQASIDFNDNINIFIGNNGEGKTNILESIYVLAITKSHRVYIDKTLINSNKNIIIVPKIIKIVDALTIYTKYTKIYGKSNSNKWKIKFSYFNYKCNYRCKFIF